MGGSVWKGSCPEIQDPSLLVLCHPQDIILFRRCKQVPGMCFSSQEGKGRGPGWWFSFYISKWDKNCTHCIYSHTTGENFVTCPKSGQMALGNAVLTGWLCAQLRKEGRGEKRTGEGRGGDEKKWKEKGEGKDRYFLKTAVPGDFSKVESHPSRPIQFRSCLRKHFLGGGVHLQLCCLLPS